MKVTVVVSGLGCESEALTEIKEAVKKGREEVLEPWGDTPEEAIPLITLIETHAAESKATLDLTNAVRYLFSTNQELLRIALYIYSKLKHVGLPPESIIDVRVKEHSFEVVYNLGDI